MITSAIFHGCYDFFLMWHSSAIRVDTAYIILFLEWQLVFVAMQYDSNEIKEDC